MPGLDPRCRAILTLLLQSDEPLTSAEIGLRLGTTARMVRYSLKDAKAWLSGRTLVLTSKAGSGAMLEGAPQAKQSALGELQRTPGGFLSLLPAERTWLLILTLLASEHPIVLKQLERLLDVSRMTVLRDLRKAEAWLKSQSLELLRRPNFGFRVIGQEYYLRRALVSLAVTCAGQIELLDMCMGNRQASAAEGGPATAYHSALRVFLDRVPLRLASRMVSSLRSEAGLTIADDSHVALSLYLALLAWRVQHGYIVESCPGSVEDLRQRREFSAAQSVAQALERRVGVSLAEPEVTCIAMVLLASEVVWAAEESPDRIAVKGDMAARAQGIADSVLAAAAAYLHPSLQVDAELRRSLQLHVGTVLDRLQFGVAVGRSASEGMRMRYPYVYDVAKRSARVFESEVGKALPEEEIGYIAMYLAAAMERLRPTEQPKAKVLVVCNAGVATAWLLVSRLCSEFPGAEVVRVMSALDLRNQGTAREVDLIVSTVPLQVPGTTVVVVTPFLDAHDLSNLGEALRSRPAGRVQGVTKEAPLPDEPALTDLLTSETIRVRLSASGWQQVVFSAGRLLVDTAAVEARYIEAMLEPILQHGPYMVGWPGIALLHGLPQQGVRRVCMALVTLDPPVPFGHARNDPVDVAVALGAVDGRIHLKALWQLVRLFDDPNAMHRLRSACDVQQVVHLLHEHTQGLLQTPRKR